jgi:hypothetical protein
VKKNVALLQNYMQKFDEFCIQDGDAYGYIVRNLVAKLQFFVYFDS